MESIEFALGGEVAGKPRACKKASRGRLGGCHGFVLEEFGLDVAAFHKSVDIALSLRLVEAVLGGKLRHQIVVALERGQILLGELDPFVRISLRRICFVSLAGVATFAFEADALEVVFVI